VNKFGDKDSKSSLYCSFCGKSQHEVRKLIAGPTVFICDECVELCKDIIPNGTPCAVLLTIVRMKSGEAMAPLVVLAEIGRHLNRARSGDKSGLSILGTGLRPIVVDATRSKPALVLLQQEGSRDLGWSGNKRFWWPILALPSDVEPCVFAGSEAA
jgi:hypothetical protein